MRRWYEARGVAVVQDEDLYATDLMKCIDAVRDRESGSAAPKIQLGIIILGGLSGRLDQTLHTMSQLHKLRKSRERTLVVTEDNVAWVLDSVSRLSTSLTVGGRSLTPRSQGEHHIDLDLSLVGPSCGLLPVGVSSTVLSTTGLVWNLRTYLKTRLSNTV